VRTRRLLWLTLAFACALGLTLWVSQMGWPVVIALVAVTLLAYAVVGWFQVLTDEERRAWLAMLSRARLRS